MGDRFTNSRAGGPWRVIWSHEGHNHEACSLCLATPHHPSSPTSLRPGKSEGPQRRPGFASYLTLCLRTTTLRTIDWMVPVTVARCQLAVWGRGTLQIDQWLSRTTNGHSLTVAWGKGPLQHQPMAEQDHQRSFIDGWGKGPLQHQPMAEQDH